MGKLRDAFSLEAFLGDGRSAAVGAVIGLFTAAVGAALAEGAMKDIQFFTNDAGYASPMPLLVDLAKSSNGEVSLAFKPAELESVFVCEFSHITGRSEKDVILSYLEKYSDCFRVRQTQKQRYLIEPNTAQGRLVHSSAGDWLCNCSP